MHNNELTNKILKLLAELYADQLGMELVSIKITPAVNKEER